MDAKIAELKEKLSEQAKKVDKTLLAKYKQKSAERINVFVEEVAGKCGGCRMEISASKLNTLKANGFIECENCGRIIYTKNK
jgi:predicted  nucleic acid-binding Zn-ribbon protein